MEVVFVVGAPRSGTTLVQRVLANHPSFYSLDAETGLFTLQDVFDEGRKHFGLDARLREDLMRSSHSLVEFFERGARALPGAREGAVFVEKTPQHALRVGYLLGRFRRARIVHVVRDGRDCFCSSQGHAQVPQRASAAAFANYWRRCVGAVARHEASPRVFVLKYEAFAADPVAELDGLMRFLGAETDERQLDASLLGQDRRARLSEFRRLGEGVNAGSVQRWRQDMAASDVEAFVRIAGADLQRLGYPLK
jgi:hypothetical protein